MGLRSLEDFLKRLKNINYNNNGDFKQLNLLMQKINHYCFVNMNSIDFKICCDFLSALFVLAYLKKNIEKMFFLRLWI